MVAGRLANKTRVVGPRASSEWRARFRGVLAGVGSSPLGGIVDSRRRAGVGAARSESESNGSALRWERRVERGERCLAGEIGEEGGERVWLEVRVALFFVAYVGVTARIVLERAGEVCSG
jgi:hypothetical protein